MTEGRRRENLTPAEKAEAFDLREQRGWSYERIARKLGCSAGSISWHCLAAGADKPNAKPLDKTIRGPKVMKRGNHVVRRYTPGDDRRLLRYATQGLGDTAIGKKLKRRANSIRGRLMTLARHEERAAL